MPDLRRRVSFWALSASARALLTAMVVSRVMVWLKLSRLSFTLRRVLSMFFVCGVELSVEVAKVLSALWSRLSICVVSSAISPRASWDTLLVSAAVEAVESTVGEGFEWWEERLETRAARLQPTRVLPKRKTATHSRIR